MYKVTIGIPVYNAARYLPQTMASALNQTFDSICFLIVDDCGHDSSIDYIRSLQTTHPRGKDIRIVHHSANKGVSEARNTLIKEADSDYLFYLDSDDLITPDCIAILYKAITAIDADVAYGSYKEVWENRNVRDTYHRLPPMVNDETGTFADVVFRKFQLNIRTFVWNILFSCRFLREHGFAFEPVTVWEDLLFTYDFIPCVRKAVFCSEITYTYVKRDGSLSIYHVRNTIPNDEISEHIHIRALSKAKCLKQIGQPYFGGMLMKTMSICYDAFSVILDKRKQITPPITNRELRQLTEYPLSLVETLKLECRRFPNFVVYLIGQLPFPVIKSLALCYRKVVVAYRRMRAYK